MTGHRLVVIDAATVRDRLTYDICIGLMHEAMTALSMGETRQLLRGIVDLTDGRAFGVMPGTMPGDQGFGAKLVSVFPERFGQGLSSHQGFLALFDASTGAPACIVDAGEITAIRTASASAAATDVLARPDATRLAVLGYGEQARGHALAIACVRPLTRITIWGRSTARAQALARVLQDETGIVACAALSVEAAVAEADIVCTTTAAAEPILHRHRIRPGTHINAVGSSRAGPVEVDPALVADARFFADHRELVLAQGSEFLRAKAMGLIDDSHILGEIGEVFAGKIAGRRAATDITLYKSLGSIAQDLASGQWLYHRALAEGFGTHVAF